MPKFPVDYVITFTFGPDNQPHGPYGYRKLHLGNGYTKSWYEPCSMEEEVAQLKDCYEHEILQHAKRQHDGYSWATVEDYLEAYRCKCGKHGTSGLEPYEGETKHK